eukprot:1393296-Amorphochlora_amoeboformis.AAC.1
MADSASFKACKRDLDRLMPNKRQHRFRLDLHVLRVGRWKRSPLGRHIQGLGRFHKVRVRDRVKARFR